MKHSNQGITRTQRGEEQPLDKDRAQLSDQTRAAKTSAMKQATRKHERPVPGRSGHSTEGD